MATKQELQIMLDEAIARIKELENKHQDIRITPSRFTFGDNRRAVVSVYPSLHNAGNISFEFGSSIKILPSAANSFEVELSR